MQPMNDEAQALLLAALERYERPLIRYALNFTGDLEEARDVVQDTFLRLSQQERLLEGEKLAPWLFTVCKNRALDFQRKHARMVITEVAVLDRETSEDAGPGDAMELRENAAALRLLIEQLPARQREAVTLKFIAGLDYKEMSRVMKTSIGNVGYLIHHGVQALRQKWREMEARQEKPLVPALAH
jgi:RNA polymerase sigma factor (sigma-70 family)